MIICIIFIYVFFFNHYLVLLKYKAWYLEEKLIMKYDGDRKDISNYHERIGKDLLKDGLDSQDLTQFCHSLTTLSFSDFC